MRMVSAGILLVAALASVPIAGYDPFEESIQSESPAPAPARDSTRTAPAAAVRKTSRFSIVVIRTFSRNGAAFNQGVGFCIAPNGTIVSNRHLFDDAYKADAATPDGLVFPLSAVKAEDKEADIISLGAAMPDSSIALLKISATLPPIGEPIMVNAGGKVISDGQVTAIDQVPGFGNIIRISASVSPAAAGSPVVNLDGQVMGILVSYSINGRAACLVIPAERINRLKPDTARTLAQWQGDRFDTPRLLAQEDYCKGTMLLWGGYAEDALGYFEKAVIKAPKFLEALSQSVYCCSLLGRQQQAAAISTRIVKLSPSDPNAQYNLALIYGDMRDYASARASLESALRLKPEFPEALALACWMDVQAGANDQAVDECKKAVTMRPDYDHAHVVLGLAYANLGRYEWAENAIQQAIRINPQNDNAFMNLGVLAAKQHKYTEASEQYRNAISINPLNYEAQCNLGELYLDKFNNAKAAVDCFLKATSARPDFAVAHFDLGKAYLKTARRAEALHEYEKLVPINLEYARQLHEMMEK